MFHSQVHLGHHDATFCVEGNRSHLAWWGLFIHCGLFWERRHTALLCAIEIDQLYSYFSKSCCTNMKTFTEAAGIAGGICSFTRQLQFVVINKVRTRCIINPNILQWIKSALHSFCITFLGTVTSSKRSKWTTPEHSRQQSHYSNVLDFGGSNPLGSNIDCLVLLINWPCACFDPNPNPKSDCWFGFVDLFLLSKRTELYLHTYLSVCVCASERMILSHWHLTALNVINGKKKKRKEWYVIH